MEKTATPEKLILVNSLLDIIQQEDSSDDTVANSMADAIETYINMVLITQ